MYNAEIFLIPMVLGAAGIIKYMTSPKKGILLPSIASIACGILLYYYML